MKLFVYPLLIVISLLLMGCPYQGEVELCTYEEALKVDKDLVGDWVAFHENGAREEVSLEKIAKSVLSVSHREYNEKSQLKNTYKYRIYATMMGGEIIFTVENKDGKYMYSKYAWMGKNVFYIQTVNQDYMDANFAPNDPKDKDELIAYFKENITKEKMFDEKLEFYRKDSPEYEKVKVFMKKSGF